MTTAADTPHADALEITASPNGKWMLFDFKVGDKHAFVSMDTAKFPKAFEYLLSALNAPALANISGPDLVSYGYFSGVVVKPAQVSCSITPLGEGIVLTVELPGAVQMGLHFPLSDVPKLQQGIADAVRLCGDRQNLTRQ
jgi:hypothetical protein